MAKAVVLTTSDASGGAKNSSVWNADTFQDPFNVSLAAVVTGTATYTVQHTFDDPQNPTTWFDHTVLAALTANQCSNYAFPVRGVRLRQTAGNGSVALTIVQAG